MPAPSTEGNEAPPLGRGAAVGAVLFGAALLVVVVVAIGSAGGDLGDGRSVVLSQGLSGFLVGSFTLLLAVGLYMSLRMRRGGRTQARRAASRLPWWARSLAGIVLLALVVLVASSLSGPSEEAARPEGGPTAGALGRLGDAAAGKPAETGGPFYAGIALAVLVAGAVAVAAVRGAGGDDAEDEGAGPATGAADEREPVASALAATLVDLADEPDPRRAVIAAYVRMQAVLATVGVRRQPSETEADLLRRALAALGADAEPAQRLTELFERARYSPHVVDEAMRAAAVAAVTELRHGLLVGA